METVEYLVIGYIVRYILYFTINLVILPDKLLQITGI